MPASNVAVLLYKKGVSISHNKVLEVSQMLRLRTRRSQQMNVTLRLHVMFTTVWCTFFLLFVAIFAEDLFLFHLVKQVMFLSIVC